MNAENKVSESESGLFKDFNEQIDNNKKEKKQEEKTSLDRDNKSSINTSKVKELKYINIKNSDYERIEKSKQRPKFSPIQKINATTQTDFDSLFLKKNEEQNSKELKFTSGESKIENSQANETILLHPILAQKNYLGKKTKNDSQKNIKKPTKNNQCNNKDKLLQKENKNNYTLKNKYNINPIKANVNKDIFINTGLNIGSIINRYKSYFVNKSFYETLNDINPNYIFNFNDIENFEKIGLFNSIEKDNLTLLYTHDILHDFQDEHNLLNYHDFHEEQRISQMNLNHYYRYYNYS